MSFEASHLPRAFWLPRGWLELKIPSAYSDRHQPIVVTCPNGLNSILAAATWAKLGYTQVSVLDGGVQAWSANGHPTEKGIDRCLIPPNDVVLSPSIKGDKAAMKRYLDWEVELTEELKG